MCLVAFQKIFRKIFYGVWKRRRKTQIHKNTSHNPEKNHQRSQFEIAISRRQDRDQRRDLATARSRVHEITINASRDRAVDHDLDPVRSREGEIVIDSAISRSVDRDLVNARSRRREIVQLIAILPSTEIAIDGAISRSVDREIAPSPLIAISRRRRRR